MSFGLLTLKFSVERDINNRTFEIFSAAIYNTLKFFQITCTGQYYEGWLDDIKPVRSYQFLTSGSFALHLILSIRIYFEKKKVDRFETKASHQRGGPMINFGGLKMAWVCLIPLGLQVITISKLDHMTPKILNDYPNYWLKSILHIYLINLFALCLLSFYAILKQI